MPEITNTSELVDISEVLVDRSLSKHERIADYIRQIKNPYHFICEGRVITAIYPKDAPPLEDCLKRGAG